MSLPHTVQPNFLILRCKSALALSGALAFFMTAVAADTNGVPTNRPAATAAAASAPLHFVVTQYEVMGNTLLPERVLTGIMSKHTGTNVTFDDVSSAVKELTLEYRNRGFDTISVTIPQQKLTNGVFKVRVFEGKLAEIIVKGNRHYSSNNVMRVLPGLRTNTFLNSKLLQPQLDLANANQDRQIYPEIHPGPDSNTTSLILRVKDQIPFHAKLEANNASTPGTPDMRMAMSGVYDNMWQLDHAFGAQYTFSEQQFKEGGSWPFYDQPLVANYSTFYRMPLSPPDSIADATARNAEKFGYNEATRKFSLPPTTGAPELNIYASGSTIDSGVTYGESKNLFTAADGSTIDQQQVRQSLTYNYAVGLRYTQPMPELMGFRTSFQAGLDFKNYKSVALETNNFLFTEFLTNTAGNPITLKTTVPSPTPASLHAVSYLPLNLHWDASRSDASGTTGFGFNYSPNIWYSSSRENLDDLSGSGESSGYWQVVSANASRLQSLPGDWKLAMRADGQWSSEPLIPNEQFGGGGVAGVRGYREGEVFGDSGWRVTSELKSPSYRIGYVGKGTGAPLIVRSSFFMDYADTYLVDPGTRPSSTPLWGTGVAGSASLGSHFNGMLMFAFPLLSTPTTEAYHIRVAFMLSAQF